MTKDIKIEKLSMEAKPYDKVLEKVMALCPAAVQNGKVDFERLKAELSDVVDEDAKQTYEFKWVGKNEAVVEANKPIRKTLRPCKEESKNWETTENLYIEGDNLEALKLLEEGYLGKIKMIYIDPPYNTGNDFVYHDNRVQSEEEMREGIGLFDEEDNRLLSTSFVKNTETGGRFHSDWCTMMYPRLKLARDLLSDDGVIFISIGEEELSNLDKMCAEIFGGQNKLGIVSRVAKTASNKGTYFAPTIDYILVYSKDYTNIAPFVGEVDESLYKKIETEGDKKGEKYRDDVALYQSALDPMRGCKNQRYFIKAPDGSFLLPPGSSIPNEVKDASSCIPVDHNDKVWRWTFATYIENRNLLVFKKTKNSPLINEKGEQANYNIYTKSYLSERRENGTLPRNLWENFINRKGADLLKKMNIPFDFSKPVELIEYICKIMALDERSIILDFFSGSATTAHAVMQLNAEDDGKRKFIMVQLPEVCDEKSEAFKAGYKNICEIGKERIRRAGEKIKAEHPEATDLDIGFRVLKVDESNMQDVYYNPAELNKDTLLASVDNIKPDRKPLDLLFGVMVNWGVSLSLPLKELKVGANTVHIVGDSDLVACFDRNIANDTITQMAKLNPTRVVFRDSCFAKDDAKINMFEIFKTICQWDDKQAKDNIRVI